MLCLSEALAEENDLINSDQRDLIGVGIGIGIAIGFDTRMIDSDTDSDSDREKERPGQQGRAYRRWRGSGPS